jgi:hypothetical protein
VHLNKSLESATPVLEIPSAAAVCKGNPYILTYRSPERQWALRLNRVWTLFFLRLWKDSLVEYRRRRRQSRAVFPSP